MHSDEVRREAPAVGIFSPDVSTEEGNVIPAAPVRNYCGYLDPRRDRAAVEKGGKAAREMLENRIADFERNELYCRRHPGAREDQMVHVSTFRIIRGVIYMTYYANTSTGAEDPRFQEARLAFCPMDDPREMTILTLQAAGDLLDGRRVDRLYDTILLYKGGRELYLLWTASVEGLYYRLYCTFDLEKRTLSAIRPNRFRVGKVVNDFSTTGITSALAANGLGHKEMFSDIGIMQKLSTRVENGQEWYYTGAYSGYFNCIIRSRDFVTWEYVSSPDFPNLSLWENAVYVLGDRCFYFVRQEDCSQGFLTCYDLAARQWSEPMLIRDAQSRSDFLYYRGELYLIHAPVDREGIGIVRVDMEDLSRSRPVLVAQMGESMFYPYTDMYGDEMYISYTSARRHIRLTRLHLGAYLE